MISLPAIARVSIRPTAVHGGRDGIGRLATDGDRDRSSSAPSATVYAVDLFFADSPRTMRGFRPSLAKDARVVVLHEHILFFRPTPAARWGDGYFDLMQTRT